MASLTSRALRAAIDREPHRLVLFAFDLLFLDGQDLRRLPLMERREKLRKLIPGDPASAIQFSDHYDGEGAELFKQACAMGLEGIVSKRALSPYKSGPSKFWLKTKNVVESELILLGTDYDNEGKPIAYLGKEAGGKLLFAGTAFMTLRVSQGTCCRLAWRSFPRPKQLSSCPRSASHNGWSPNSACASAI